MAINTITYQNKVTLNSNPDVADVNKVKADDMNEIKSVVNNNATELSQLVVYDQTITTAASSYTISGLDLLSDEEYEFLFILYPSNESQTSDYKLSFNDETTTTYATNFLGAYGSLTTAGSLTWSCLYRGYLNAIGDYWSSSIDKKKPAVLSGRLILVDDMSSSGNKNLYVETNFEKINHGSQASIKHTAISTSNVANVTSINMTQSSATPGNYGAGSRFIIRKKIKS